MLDDDSNDDDNDDDDHNSSDGQHGDGSPKYDENEVFWSEEDNTWKSKNFNGIEVFLLQDFQDGYGSQTSFHKLDDYNVTFHMFNAFHVL